MKAFILVILIAIVGFKPVEVKAQVNVQDSLALIDLYNAAGGANWNTTWKPATLVSTWQGITVANNRVVVLNLDVNNLIGYIPASLGNLNNLTELQLWDNQLSDTIPASLGNLTNLTILSLGANHLTGNIPASFGNFTKLTSVDLGYNQLTGNIPSSLGNLTNLTGLGLDSNHITGTIPTSFGNLINLTGLYLGYNQLTGAIPDSLGNLSKLSVLELSYNQLAGAIPAALKNLNKLTELDLNNNHFTFDDMEYFAQQAYTFYSPQAIIPLHYNRPMLSVSAGGSLANNVYRWYNDNALVATILGDSTYTPATIGNYSVAVKNTIATQLTLLSDTITVASINVCFWTGTISNDWSTTGNWSCGNIPDSNTDVVINSGLVNYPVINSAATCRSLFIDNAASIIVKSPYNLTITH